MKRVLIVGMTANPGGIENVIMNYYRNVDKSKIQFDFLCNTGKMAYEEEIADLGGKIIEVASRSKDYMKYKKSIEEFFKLNAKKYSAIWVNFCNLTNLDYLKLAKKYGIKKRIIHSHNSQNMYSKAVKVIHNFNKLFVEKYATDFWACTEDASKWFFNKKIENNHKIEIVNNAIDLDKFKYNEELRNQYRSALKLEDKIVIGHVGRFHTQKNHEFLIDIFNQISKKEKNAHLLLVGQGEEREKIENKVKQLNLESKVSFLGVRSDVPQVMQAMDCFLFPSIFEGLGLVLVEAQATGMPTIASKDVIPNDAKMSDNFTFISLNESANVWADRTIEVLSGIEKDNRKSQCDSNIEKIRKNGYDIKFEAKKIEHFFEGE